MTISLEGSVAVVTGAGRGIGRAHVQELSRRGAAVMVNDVDKELADEVVAGIVASGGRAVAAYDSVTDAGAPVALVGRALDELGGLDIVVHNAGVLRTGYFDELSDEHIDVVLQTHLRAAFALTRPAWQHMKRRGYGRIVITSSSSGLFSHQGLSNYAAAKAGLYGLTKALSFEGASHGIKVNAILPYATSISPAKDPIPDMAKFRAEYEADRPVDPERTDPRLIAQLVSYLVSRDCPVSGEAYSACYGRFARVFVGVADGWLAPDPAVVSSESIAEHFDQIRDLSGYSVPMWLFEETRDVQRRLAADR
jgi:NAD(P)-dependent dehydrogenase (short-subunit alcohol dehydrogenase family)